MLCSAVVVMSVRFIVYLYAYCFINPHLHGTIGALDRDSESETVDHMHCLLPLPFPLLNIFSSPFFHCFL